MADLGLRAPLTVLDRHGVRYVVIGGIAAIAQGYPLTTQDVDVTPDPALDNIEMLVAALDVLGAKRRTSTNAVEFPLDAKMIADAEAWTLETILGPLDLIFFPFGTRGYDDLSRDAVGVDLGLGTTTSVASLRDLIRMKEASSREKDRAQLPALRRTLEITKRRSDLEQ